MTGSRSFYGLLYACLLGISSLVSGIEISCETTTLGSGIHTLPGTGLTCTSGSTTIQVTGIATIKVPLADAGYTFKGLRFRIYIPFGISPSPILTFSRQGVAGPGRKLKFTENTVVSAHYLISSVILVHAAAS
jgi:hypothetical protein